VPVRYGGPRADATHPCPSPFKGSFGGMPIASFGSGSVGPNGGNHRESSAVNQSSPGLREFAFGGRSIWDISNRVTQACRLERVALGHDR
jgi:hypothetical protein